MEAYLKLWTDRLEPATSFVDAEYFEQHSSTFKIINGSFRDPLITYISDEDNEDKRHPYNTRRNANKKNVPPGKGNAQMNKPKQKEQDGKPGFVPCFVDEHKMKYPKFSALNGKQQALVVQLMQKYRNRPKFPTPVEEAELQQLQELLNRISNERHAFDNFTKSQCGLNSDRYTFIKPEVMKYIGKLWKHKISQISRYPTYYETEAILRLVYPTMKDRIVLCMKQVLMQMGTAPIVRFPSLKRPLHVSTSYAIHLPDNSIPNGDLASAIHLPVSQDPNAEKLAKLHNADVVISFSGLKRILNNRPPFDKEWQLPVSIKEYTNEEQGRTTKSKVVYIDKALAPTRLTTVERNSWFYKTAIRNLLVNKGKYYKNISNEDYKDCPLASIPSQQAKRECESSDLESCNSKVDTKLSMRNGPSIKSVELNEENAFHFEATLNSKQYAKNNIQQPLTKNVKKRKYFEDEEYQDSDDDRLIMDCSDTEELCKKKRKQKGDRRTSFDISENENENLKTKKFSIEKYKQSSDDTDSEEDSKDRMVIDWNISHEFSGLKLTSDTIRKGALHQQTSSELNGSKNADNVEIMSCQNLEHPIDNSVTKGGDIQKKATFVRGTTEIKTYTNKKKNKGNNMSESQFTSLPAGKNVTYRLWELKLEGNSMQSQKDNFNKGKHSFKILVRTKVDGCEDDSAYTVAEVQTVRVIPKLEYQCEFGAECLTQDELFAQWAIALFNPEANLIRVRLDPIKSEVMMFESVSSQEALQQSEVSSKDFLCTLFGILQGLIGQNPGNYLLSHDKKMESSAFLRRAESPGRFNLQSCYNIDTFALPEKRDESYPWNPIDRKIITPFHRAYNRVPASFPPVSENAVKLKNLNKRKKKKRNKKAKKLTNSAVGPK